MVRRFMALWVKPRGGFWVLVPDGRFYGPVTNKMRRLFAELPQIYDEARGLFPVNVDPNDLDRQEVARRAKEEAGLWAGSGI